MVQHSKLTLSFAWTSWVFMASLSVPHSPCCWYKVGSTLNIVFSLPPWAITTQQDKNNAIGTGSCIILPVEVSSPTYACARQRKQRPAWLASRCLHNNDDCRWGWWWWWRRRKEKYEKIVWSSIINNSKIIYTIIRRNLNYLNCAV